MNISCWCLVQSSLVLLYSNISWGQTQPGRLYTSLRQQSLCDFSETATQFVYIIYIFYSYFQPLLHMNQKATFIFSLWGKVISKSNPTRSVGWILFVSVCRYTQHVLTVYLSHVEISLKVSLEIETFTKKNKTKNHRQQKSFWSELHQHIFIRTHSEKNICYEFHQLLFSLGGGLPTEC